MFGLGGLEIAIIVVFGFLIFGPDKLPQMARTIGRVIRQFRTAQEQMNKVIKAEVYDPLKDLEPLVNPFSALSLDGKDAAKKAEPEKKTSKLTDTKKVESKSAEKDAPSTKTTSPAKEAAPKKTESTPAAKADSKTAVAAAAATAKSSPSKTEDSAKEAAKEAAAPSAPAESFAERRARLEQEHAKTKAAQEAAATAAPTASAVPAAPAPAAPVASDERKEDEKGN